MSASKPKWAPECPYPAEEFPSMHEELNAAIPNMGTRALVIAWLQRQGWEMAEEAIYDRMEKAMHNAAVKPETERTNP